MTTAEPTTENIKDALDSILPDYAGRRQEIIPLLQDVQEELGYLPTEAMERVAEFVNVPASDVFGVATFYTQFHLSPPGEHSIQVCQGTACHVRGGKRILQAVQEELGIGAGETTDNYRFSLDRVACVGSCALAPVVVVNDTVYGRMTLKKTLQLLREIE
mgnify:CR=1 FL=1